MRKVFALLALFALAPALMAPSGGVPSTVPQYFVTAAEVSAGVAPVKLGFPVANALRYGCDPTGTVSSTACIAALATYLNFVGGGTAYFPAGKYLTSGNSFTLGRILIKGDGPDATFIYNSSTNTPALTFGDNITQRYGGGIEGVTFAGAAGVTGVTGQTAFTFQLVGQFRIDNVTVLNAPSALYRGAYFLSGSQFVVHNLQVQNTTLDGVTLLGAIDPYVTDSRSDSNGQDGWNLNAAQGGYFKSDTAFNNGVYAWALVSTTPSVSANKNNFFIGCVGDTSGNHNWNVGDSVNSYFIGDWGSTQKSAAVNTGATGFFISGLYSNGLYFTGGQAINNNAHGVQIFDAGSAPPTNIYFDNFQFGSTSGGAQGNGQSGVTAYGLSLNGAVNHVRVNGGSFGGNFSGAYINQSTATDNCISGNPVGAANTSCQGSQAPRTVWGTITNVAGCTISALTGSSGITACTWVSNVQVSFTISPAYTTIPVCTAAFNGVTMAYAIGSLSVTGGTITPASGNAQPIAIMCVGT